MSKLRVRSARGSLFMASITIGTRPISTLLAIILARLLSPEDFGLVALAMVLVRAANLFTDMGMRPTVVQTKQDIGKVSYYAFVIVMVASAIVTIIIMLLAAPLASLLGGGEALVPIVRWLAIIVTIDGLWIIPEALLQRNLRFKELGIAKLPGAIGSTAIAIPLALAGYGVWSLVIGSVLGQVVRALLIWKYAGTWVWLRPKKFDKAILKEMFRFGWPTMGGGFMGFLHSQADTLIVGRQLGTVAVGYYSKAWGLTTRMSDMLTTSIFGNVLFPSYAKIQDDKARLSRAYLKSTAMVFLVIAPVSIGLAVAAPLLVPVLLGQKWAPMIPLWQIFSLYGLTRPISTNSSPLFLATGQPRRNLTAGLLLLVVMLVFIFLLIEPYGTVGVAVAVAAAYTVAMFFNIFQVNQILPGTASRTIRQSMPFLFAGGLMAIGVIYAQDTIINLAGGENALALVLIILFAAFIYLAAVLMLQRALILELYELTIVALGFDRRWPRLLPAHLRTTK